MEHRLSATELARNVGDVLSKIRYRGDSFVIERNGEPVARIGPMDRHPHASVREGLAAWNAAGEPDGSFADDLEDVSAGDRPPKSPWDS